MEQRSNARKAQNKTLIVCLTIVALSFIAAQVYINERDIESRRQISEQEMNAANKRSVMESLRDR